MSSGCPLPILMMCSLIPAASTTSSVAGMAVVVMVRHLPFVSLCDLIMMLSDQSHIGGSDPLGRRPSSLPLQGDVIVHGLERASVFQIRASYHGYSHAVKSVGLKRLGMLRCTPRLGAGQDGWGK